MKKKQLIINLAKWSAVIALIGFLANRGLLSLENTRRAFDSPSRIAWAAAATLVATALGVFRWHRLLSAHQIHLEPTTTFQLTMIGTFFNIALPGAVSGDFVKAYYIAKEMPGKRSKAFGSILFDRVVGVSGLVLISAGALLAGFSSLHQSGVFQGIQAFVAMAALSIIAFFSYLFLLGDHRDPILKLLRRWESKSTTVGSVLRIYEGLRHYRHHPGVVIESLAVSVVIHALVSFSCLQFTYALESTEFPLLAVFAVVPLGLLVTAIPLAPAGVGTGHTAFGWLFLLLGSRNGANAFSLMVLFQLFLSGLGGIIYLRFKKRLPMAALSSE